MSEPSADLRDTWATFCDLLRESGDVVLREDTPDDTLDHAEGYRMLTRLLRAGLEKTYSWIERQVHSNSRAAAQ